ncbi:MAG: hypothetical protein B6241_00045 [Spirochaetaceae bacterium 4572_59]|nr:MAG: hypothetical protein B6241_00045 [Spirochaetaceae bacterium 4572_59]
MLLKTDSRLIRFILHFLLFLLYWSEYAGNLPFAPGLLLFVLLYLLISFVMRHSSLSLISSVLVTILLFIIFPLNRIFLILTSGMNLPGDFVAVLFSALYSLILLPVLISTWIRSLSERFVRFYLLELLLYACAFALFLGKRDWNLQDSSGSLLLTFATLGISLTGMLILLLSQGKGSLCFSVPGDFLLLLMILVLVLIPVNKLYRSESVKEGGGLLESNIFHFDFTDYLTLESKISMKDELVFLMQKEGPGERCYLRRFVLGSYSPEKGFFRDPENTPESYNLILPDYKIPEKPVSWDVPDYKMREAVEQNLFYINFDSGAFLGMNQPLEIIPYYSWENSSFSRIYKLNSSVSQANVWDLLGSSSPAISPESRAFLDYYTENNGDEDIRDLAEEITGGLNGYYRKVAAIEDYLISEYSYSLNPGTAAEGDQLRHFLFSAKKGYCSYFAFSMTLLCRSLGIPSRVVLGFWVDTGSEVLNFYPVNANQAHAWVEVYFPEYGWIGFDPTSQTLAEGENFEFASYNPEELEPYIQEILANQENLIVSDLNFDESQTDRSLLIRENLQKLQDHPFRVFFLLLLLLCFASVFRMLKALSPFPCNQKRVIPYYRCYSALYRTQLSLKTKDLSPAELARIGKSVGAEEFYTFTESYLALRFSPSSEDLPTWFYRGRYLRRELYIMAGVRGVFRLLIFLLVHGGGKK